MPHHHTDKTSIPIAVAPGALWPLFSRVLAAQRAEEPDIRVSLVETSIVDQAEGLKEGRYSAGLSLERSLGVAVASVPLWREEIAVALPPKSPLLELPEIPLDDLVRYPLVMWSADDCRSLAREINTVLSMADRPIDVAEHVRSFGLFATLVAAGYGAGLAAKTKIVEARKSGIVMRPLAGDRHYLTTYLLYPRAVREGSVQRFIERAKVTAEQLQPHH